MKTNPEKTPSERMIEYLCHTYESILKPVTAEVIERSIIGNRFDNKPIRYINFSIHEEDFEKEIIQNGPEGLEKVVGFGVRIGLASFNLDGIPFFVGNISQTEQTQAFVVPGNSLWTPKNSGSEFPGIPEDLFKYMVAAREMVDVYLSNNGSIFNQGKITPGYCVPISKIPEVPGQFEISHVISKHNPFLDDMC